MNNCIKFRELINNYFHDTYLAKYPVEIHNMLIHLFNDGKRLRPMLFLAFNDIDKDINKDINEDIDKDINEDKGNDNPLDSINIWVEYAIEIELLHCLSLIIDDLPDMDNEIERRGKTCFHVLYGLQKTNFFLYYMFSKLSSNLTSLLNFHKKQQCSINNRLFKDITFLVHYLLNNLIDGQYIDIANDKLMALDLENLIDGNSNVITQVIISIYDEKKSDKDKASQNIKNHIILNIKKTGTLFAIPIITGFLCQLYKKNLEYTGKEIIIDEFYLPNDIQSEAKEISISKDGIVEALEGLNRVSQIPDTSNEHKIQLNLDDDNLINLIIIWASFLGFLYQTSDDFLDMHSDAARDKPNICNIMGKEQSKQFISRCIFIVRELFTYISSNIMKIWPAAVIIDNKCINSIIDLIESRCRE